MTVDITQEEMNILNLNGLSVENVSDSVNFMRAQGLDDKQIRNRYDELLGQLKPVTPTNINDTAKIKKWKEQGGIAPFEYGKRQSYFDPTTLYQTKFQNSAVVEDAGLNDEEKAQLDRMRKKYEQWKSEHKVVIERNQRIYSGNGTLGDNIMNALGMNNVFMHDDGQKMSQKVQDIIGYEIARDMGYLDREKETKTGKIGVLETLGETWKSDEWMPIYGGFIEGQRNEKTRAIAEKIKNGEDIRPDEYQYIQDIIDKQKEENVRGRTIGGHIAQSLLPSLIRFGGEMAIGGWVLKGLGIAPELATSGRTAEGIAYSTLKDRALFGVKDMLATGTVNTLNPLTGGSETYAAYQERMKNAEFDVTKEGEMVFKEAQEKPATAFMKSMLGTLLMFASEGSGALIGIPVNAVGTGIKKAASPIAAVIKSNPQLVRFVDKVMPKLSQLYEKTLGVPAIGKTRDFLKSAVHYDGFLEEIGEEKLEELLRFSLGVDNEEINLENLTKHVFGSPDEWAILCGTVALQGFLLGGTSHIIGKVLEQNGASDEEIVKVIKTLPQEEQLKAIAKMIDDGTLKLDAPLNEAENVKQDFKNNLLKQGVSEKNAELASRIYSAFQLTRSDRTGRSIEELYAEDNLKIVERNSEEDNAVKLNQIENLAQFAGADENEIEEAKKEWQEKSTESRFFKKWFGDSKVVDENGKPLVVYHGTENNFKIFKNLGQSRQIGSNVGFFFTDSKKMAQEYANGERVMPVYLSLKNPLIIEQNSNISMFGDKIEITDAFDFFTQLDNKVSEQKLKQELINKGHDGIILRNTNVDTPFLQDVHDVYVAFDNTQIKSINNRGTFDTKNPNIYYQGKEKELFNLDGTKVKDPYNPSDYDYIHTQFKNKKREEQEKVKIEINPDLESRKDEIVKPKELNETKLNLLRTKENTPKIIENALKNYLFGKDKKQTKETNNNTGKTVIINGASVHEMVNEVHNVKTEEKNKADFRETLYNIVANSKHLFNSAEYILSYDEAKNAELKGKQKVDKYANIVNTKYGEFVVVFTVFNRNDIGTVKLYDLESYQKNRFSQPRQSADKTGMPLTEPNNSITYLTDFVKSKVVEKYNYDYKDLQKEQNGQTFFQGAYHGTPHKFEKFSLEHIGTGEGAQAHGWGLYFAGDKNISEEYRRKLSGDKVFYNGKELEKTYVYTHKIERGINKKFYQEEKSDDTLLNWEKLYPDIDERTVERLFDEKVQRNSENSRTGLVQRPDRRRTANNQKKLEPEQINIFPGNMEARKIRKVKGSYIPVENIIELFKNADESTIVHEFAHWYLTNLIEDAKYSEASAQDLEAVRKLVRNNGENFTVEQHEKFARAFEVYIRSGYAKNNRLKKIFEDFKNALLSIYDTIKQIIFTEEGIEKSFTEEDLPQINALFERLLSTENERIKATVFDKIDEIDDKIRTIKENEQKEFEELDKFWRDNMSVMNRQSDKKRQVDEYIELAEKMTSRETKEIKEYKKRFKEATLQILEAATGYDRRFISNPKNFEKVQEKISNADDKITTSDGFLPNWAEFYTDTGVSYENDETDGDYKLAEQAFNVLTDGTYNHVPGEDYRFEEIEKFISKIDYLAAKVKTLKGEEKETAFEAFAKVISEMPSMPDEITEDVVKKLDDVGNEFEEDSKNDFNRKTLTEAELIWQLQYKITKKLNDLKVYNPETRYKMRLNKSHKLYRYIKDVNSVNDAKQNIRRINEFIIEDMKNNQRSLLHKEIQRQIKINSKVVKTGTIKHGKFDWRTNSAFSELAEMNKLTREQAEKEFNALIQSDKITDGEERDSVDEKNTGSLASSDDFQELLKKEFLQYRKSRLPEMDVTHTKLLLSHILELKFEGRRAKSKEELKKKLNRYDYETDLIDILNENRDNKLAKYIARWVAGDTALTSEATLANWETLLNTLFNKETAQKYSLLYDEAQAEVYAHNKCLEFYKRIAEIYGFETASGIKGTWDKALDYDNIQPIVNLFNQYDNEIYTYTQKTFNKYTEKYVDTEVDLSRSEIITLFAWSLNEELEQRIFTQFGLEQTKDMFSKLSDADMELAWAMVDICDSMYEDTNEVFIRTTGLSLPRVQNYIPSKTERVLSDIDMMHEAFVRSNNPSFIKERKFCNRIKMNPQNPLAIIIPHINKTAKYVVLSEKVNYYNKIFGSADVKNAMVDVFRYKKKGKNASKSGEKIYQILLNQLATSTFENYAKSVTVGKNLIDTIASNYISSRIGGNLKVMFSQLTSVINYAENMPSVDWGIGFTKALANPKETIKFMLDNCDYLKSRLAGNSQNEIISRLTSETDRFRTIRNFCTMNTRYGDITAIIFGGKPYVDYLMNEKGLSKEEAFKQFIESTLRSQQSGHNSATSAWQKKQAENAFTRMVFAFNNTNLQYERKWVDAISQVAKGDITKGEFAKAFLIYKVFNPILFTSFLTNLTIFSLVRGLFGGGDDDELQNAGIDIALSIILSNIKAYGILGVLADSFVKIIVAQKTKDKYFDNSLPLISDFEDVTKKLFKDGELSFADYIKITASAVDYTTPISATRLTNVAGGIYDMSQGAYGIGVLETIGYGEYRATYAATGKKPNKKTNKKKRKGITNDSTGNRTRRQSSR